MLHNVLRFYVSVCKVDTSQVFKGLGWMGRRKGRRDGEEEGKERWRGGREGEMGRRKGTRDGEEEGKERWGGGREGEMVEEGMQLSGQYHHVHPHT